MKIVKKVQLGKRPPTSSWNMALSEIEKAIRAVVWPPGTSAFTVHPESGKKRGEGNGVVPIHKAFLAALDSQGWETRRGKVKLDMDADKDFPDGYVGLEWETGNISSSHRSLNRLRLAQQQGCIGGVLILPTKNLAQYLTDRIGNFEELERYLPLYDVEDSLIEVYGFEHDFEDVRVPRIGKGTDGRSLL